MAERDNTKPGVQRKKHYWRGIALGVGIFIILLAGARLAMPWAIKEYVNHRLKKIPEYSGRVRDIRVHLWRGAYEIDDIHIDKTSGKVPVPFFSASNIDLSLQWNALFRGAAVGTVVMHAPQVNFVAAPIKAQSQTGAQKPWGQTLKSLVPFRINQLKIYHGRIHFRDDERTPHVDLYVTNLTALCTNLTNIRKKSEPLPAGVNAWGKTIGGGDLLIALHMNPLDRKPTFQLNASLTNVDVTALNNFMRAYGKFDVARGNMELFISAASVHGNYKSVVKVLFKDLDVFEWEKERGKNVLKLFWEAIVGAVVDIFKNKPHDQLATEFTINGTFNASHTDAWEAVWSILHDAFIRALLPEINRPVHLNQVQEPGLPPKTPPVSLPQDMHTQGH